MEIKYQKSRVCAARSSKTLISYTRTFRRVSPQPLCFFLADLHDTRIEGILCEHLETVNFNRILRSLYFYHLADLSVYKVTLKIEEPVSSLHVRKIYDTLRIERNKEKNNEQLL